MKTKLSLLFKSIVINNEKGSAIIFAILALVVLTLIGIVSITTSRFETDIAGNDMLQKKAFYSADGGTEIAREMVEECLSCPLGISPASSHVVNNELRLDQTESFFRVTDLDFAYQENAIDADDDGDGTWDFPTDTEKDIWFGDSIYNLDDYDTNADGLIIPGTDNLNLPHTNIVAFGDTQLVTGSALQMAAGYEGKGKGAASGGGKIVYEVHSRYVYPSRNSTAYIRTEYWHRIGQEGDCRY